MDPAERLRLFIERMRAAPAASNYRDARQLLSDVLNAVEDEHSGVPFNSENWMSDGRMYPPQDDSRLTDEDAEIVVFRSRGHLISIFQNGRIIIEVRRGKDKGRIVFDK